MRAASARMTRPIVLAVVFGAIAAVGTLYAGSYSERLNGKPVAGKLGFDDWPICSSIAMAGSEAEWAALDPDFAAGKRALARSDWTNAVRAFEFASVRDPRDADVLNYIGYAYRRLGQLGPAMGYFQQALSINPRHRGAREHLGELFLELKEPARAEEHLAVLKQVCLVPCEEVGRLQEAIQSDRSSFAR